MRKLVAPVLVVVFAASSAFGGIVTFDPGSANVLPGETATFGVSIAVEQLAEFDAADIVLGSNDLDILSFVYAQSWIDMSAFSLDDPVPAMMYPSDLFFGAFLSAAVSSAVVGELTVGTSGLGMGTYEFFVDSTQDYGVSGLSLVGVGEGLKGTGYVNVVPEPATLALLALGGIAVLRRRTA